MKQADKTFLIGSQYIASKKRTNQKMKGSCNIFVGSSNNVFNLISVLN